MAAAAKAKARAPPVPVTPAALALFEALAKTRRGLEEAAPALAFVVSDDSEESARRR